jgi:enoyl-CoA hydratase/carnithine racemase
MTAREAVEWGLVSRFADTLEDRVVWLTLTDTAAGRMDLPELSARWRATAKRLRRIWGATDYLVSIEFQARGALHPHVCIEVDGAVAKDLTDRKSRGSYRRRMHELRPMAESLGWGQMVDAVTIDTLGGREEIGRYAAKNLSGYATKEAKERFKRAGAKHVRPTRLSYGWVPGGLAAARGRVLGRTAMESTRLEGKWERIRSLAC